MHCDLDLADMTLSQGHVTPFGHGQQLCDIIQIQPAGKNLWHGQNMNRWTQGLTDKHGNSYIPSVFCLQGL